MTIHDNFQCDLFSQATALPMPEAPSPVPAPRRPPAIKAPKPRPNLKRSGPRPVTSLGEGLAIVKQEQLLAADKIRRVAWAVRSLEKATFKSAMALPCYCPELVPLLQGPVLAEHGTKKTWTIRHYLRVLLETLGRAVPRFESGPVSDPAWQEAVAAGTAAEQRRLKPFAKFCLERELSPAEITDEVFRIYARWRTDFTFYAMDDIGHLPLEEIWHRRGLAPRGPVASLDDARHRVSVGRLLSPKTIKEVDSAISALEQATGRIAAELPCDCTGLRKLLEGVLLTKVHEKRASNIRTALRAMLEVLGLHAPSIRPLLPAGSAWHEVLDPLDRHQKAIVYPFARFCVERWIEPAAVEDATLDAYREWRLANTIYRFQRNTLCGIRCVWNRQANTNSAWPGAKIAVKRSTRLDSLPLESFPESFQNDLATYLAQRSSNKLFKGYDRPLRPITRANQRQMLIRCASICATKLGGPEHVTSLATIVALPNYQAIVEHIHSRLGGQVKGSLWNVATLLPAIARDYLRQQGLAEQLMELKATVKRAYVADRPRGLSQRVLGRLHLLRDPKLRRDLFRLPHRVYAEARSILHQRPVRAAQLFDSALIVHVALHSSMRRYNIASIHMDHNLERDRTGRLTSIHFDPASTKNGNEIRIPLDNGLIARIEEYIREFRPRLPGSESRWLFSSPAGTHRSADNTSHSFAKLTKRKLGVDLNIHIVRHLAAQIVYAADPNNGLIAQRLLGHTNLKNTERMYGSLKSAGAVEQYHGMIEEACTPKKGSQAAKGLPTVVDAEPCPPITEKKKWGDR